MKLKPHIRDAIPMATTLIQKYEGCRLNAYLCPAKRWTVGWGAAGPQINSRTIWTQNQADADLDNRVRSLAHGVIAVVKPNLKSNELAALISFAYNLGIGNLSRSTLIFYLNQGERERAADEFLRWDKVNGQTVLGLSRRRNAERELFLRLPQAQPRPETGN